VNGSSKTNPNAKKPPKIATNIRFCDRFIDKRSRTHYQMVQAARSGNKNIAEGSRISGTSKETELKLTNVARASLEELLGDYKDYLRQHGHKLWDKNSKEAELKLTNVARASLEELLGDYQD